MKEKNFYEILGTSFELFFALNFDSQTSGLKICVKNGERAYLYIPQFLNQVVGLYVIQNYGNSPATSFNRP